MQLDELQSVRDNERRSDRLQQLRESFYEDAGEYIRQLRAERDRAAERTDDPFDDPEVNRLSDEISTAEDTIESIYQKRVGKIVKAASLAAADMPSSTDEMTREERELFETLVTAIEQNRERVFGILDGTDPDESGRSSAQDSTVPNPADRGPADSESQSPELSDDRSQTVGQQATDSIAESSVADPPSAADLMGGTDQTSGSEASGEEPAASASTDGSGSARRSEPTPDAGDGTRADRPVRNDGGTATVQRQTVRITDDIEPFVGFDDREYDLAEEDVVSLPSTNVGPLVEQGVAEPFE